jgi:hypothetical protein
MIQPLHNQIIVHTTSILVTKERRRKSDVTTHKKSPYFVHAFAALGVRLPSAGPKTDQTKPLHQL